MHSIMANYRNLVFKGGGVRGIAYLGALEYLFEQDLMRRVERVAGTSVGAITAAAVALNFDEFSMIKEKVQSLDYREVPAEGDELLGEMTAGKDNRFAARLQSLGVMKNLQCTTRLLQDKGWYSSDYLYNWIQRTIASQFTANKPAYTFRDFKDEKIHLGHRRFLDLYITGTDVTNRRVRIFSFDTTPDMEVALAVRISMSIPLFFETIPFRYPGTESDQLYVDGGIMWNYPISIFDSPKYGKKILNGINKETLGFFLYSSLSSTGYKDVKSMVDYIGALFESLLLVQENLAFQNESTRSRSVFIDDKGVPQTNFNIVPGDATYKKLYRSGYEGTKAFFSRESNPETLIARIQRRLRAMHITISP